MNWRRRFVRNWGRLVMRYRLDEIVDVTMGQSPKSEYYNTEKNGYPFLQGNRTFGFKYPTFDTYTTVVTKFAKAGDVIMSVRAPVGALNITPLDMCLGRGVCSLRMKNGNQSFLFYMMKYYVSHLLKRESGTVFGSVNRNDINGLEVDIPEDVEEQKRIARYLEMIDDKIELNNAINNNLEQQAQALFKEWFIDNLENAEWSASTFKRLIQSTLNGDWGKETPTGNNVEKVYCIRGADISEVKAGNKGKLPTRYILPKNLANKKLEAGDIVVEISGGSPTQSTGRCAAITQSLLDRYDSSMVCTNFCKAIKPQTGYSLFVYYYWQYLYEKGVFFSYENGTTGIKNLDFTGFIETEPIFIPPLDKIQAFDDYCKSIFNQVFANGKQSEQLASLRDMLLPKLMSGALDVSNIDI